MAFYRSAFVAADNRALKIQDFFSILHAKGLSPKERYKLVMHANGELWDILKGTDYEKRLNLFISRVREKQKTTYISDDAIATVIIMLLREYVDLAGINGRGAVKVIERRDDGLDDLVAEDIKAEYRGEVSEDELI